jgi:EmrB/QacA subfamily drug resistance transporter
MKFVKLYVLCIAVLVTVLDTTIVTVALPSIIMDLNLSRQSITWIQNAYMLGFGGFLILAGRLGDLFGPRRVLLVGLVVFTAGSLGCGLSGGPIGLIISRALQGPGAAMVAAVALSLILGIFPEGPERTRALAIYGVVSAAGGALGDILGAVLVRVLSWHWIFFVNLPICICILILIAVLIPVDSSNKGQRQVGVVAALSLVGATSIATYMLVSGSEFGFLSLVMMAALVGLVAFVALFLKVEHHSDNPLIPLRLLLIRNFAIANIVGLLWSSGAFAWSVICALYLQRVLGYQPLYVGIAFLPATAIMLVFSAGLSARVVGRFGIRGPITFGLAAVSLGLALFSRVPVIGAVLSVVLPGMVLVGLGTALTATPLQLIAMREIEPQQTGLAAGIFTTAFVLGSAFGLALLGGLADARSAELNNEGVALVSALSAGYQLAFVVGALLVAAAGAVSALAWRHDPAPSTTRSERTAVSI